MIIIMYYIILNIMKCFDWRHVEKVYRDQDIETEDITVNVRDFYEVYRLFFRYDVFTKTT